MSDFIIHGTVFSPYVQATLITLAEKGEGGTLQPMSPGEVRSEPHLLRHPFGKMPVLEHRDFALYETQAILRYLDRALPTPPLTPADIREAARMDQVMNINDHYLMHGVNEVIGFHRVVAPMLLGLEPDLHAVAEAMPRARRVFGVLDGMLRGRDFFAGPTMSLADITVYPQMAMLAHAPEWGELTESAADLVAWKARMSERPGVVQVFERARMPVVA